MSEEERYRYIIDEFLKKVKQKLPSWIREDSKECSEIIEEMKEHIWDLAQDLAGGSEEEIRMENIHEAIARMGSPDDIAKEYKKRGTPKYYITEEWVPWYKKIITVVFGLIIAINVISLLFSLGKEGFWQISESFLVGIWNASLISIIIISIIFMALSMEGYLPQNFEEMYNKYGKYVEKEYGESKSFNDQRQSQINLKLDRLQRDLERFERKTERNARRTERAKEQVSKQIKKKHNKPPVKVGNCLSSGIFGILWGMFLIMQPIQSANIYFTPEFLEYVRLMGVLNFSEAIINLFQAFAGVHRSFIQQILIFLLGIIAGLYISVFVSALRNPGILHIFSAVATISWDPSVLFKWILYISIFGTSIGIFQKIGDIAMYQSRLRRYYEEKYD